MSLGEVIDAIWALPWYKVMAVAIIDDFLLLLKVWPLWAVVAIIAIIVGVRNSRKRG